MAVTQAATGLAICFGSGAAELAGSDNSVELRLPMPVLAGDPVERLPWEGEVRRADPFWLVENESSLIGAAVADASGRMEEPAEQLYRRLLDECEGWHLHRIWNYVPQINAIHGGLERYQQFNIGRWSAFEARYGRDLRSFMPAASAVGIGGRQAAIAFIAGKSRPACFENPLQIPAYHYPPDYGPKPPGFARGVSACGGRVRSVYLSGTASIEGHRSIGEGDWASQFKTALRNVETMLDRMGASQALRAEAWQQGGSVSGSFKCYLRHAESLSLTREWIEEQTGLTDEQVTFLQADICRNELDLEIEAMLSLSDSE